MSKAIMALYESQPWIMEPAALKAFAERIAELPEASEVYAIKIERQKKQLPVVDGVARIRISGYLLESVPDWMKIWGINATSYNDIADEMAEAVERDDVNSIELVVDSPGGSVAGVIKAADAIYTARAVKPVEAVVNNLAASGAYWLSSQAHKITASDINALIGSIGVYTYYVDYSKLYEEAGIKVVVIRSGEIKGMGLDKITAEQIEAVSEYINDTAGNFISQVARGRNAEKAKIKELATGKLWIASKAKKLALIDNVTKSATVNINSVDANSVAETLRNNSPKIKELIMDNEENIQANAEQLASARAEGSGEALEVERNRIKAINDQFGDDLQFANTAIAEGWTMEKANAEYVTVLKGRIKETGQKAAASSEQAEGAEAISSEDTDTESQGDFIAEARALAEEKGISVTAAMKKLKRQKPLMYQEFASKSETQGHQMYAEAV
jgi:signal peptide peptidase SppA